MLHPPPISTLFPYTTLFRSHCFSIAANTASTEAVSSTSQGMTNDEPDRKSTRLNSSHLGISYAVFCLKKKKKNKARTNCHTRPPGNTERSATEPATQRPS